MNTKELNYKDWIERNLLHDMQEVYRDKRIEKELPEILVYVRLWDFKANMLRSLHIFLGTLATFSSLFAASQILSNSDYTGYAAIFAFIAAISVALMTAFNLGEKSNNFRIAWRLLNVSVIRFNQNLCEKNDVIDAYERGETLIGEVAYQQPK